MVARPWSSSRLSCGEHLLLRCDGNAANSFPSTQGKDPSSRARRRKRGSSGCGWDSRASSRVETVMSGNFLSCIKGVRDPLDVPDVRCVYLPYASAEMGLISPGGEDLLDFNEFRQSSRLAKGTSGTRSGGLRKGQSPCKLYGISRDSSPDGNAGHSFPTTQGNDTSSRARKRKRGSSGCGWDYRASSRVETGMLGIFLSCSKV